MSQQVTSSRLPNAAEAQYQAALVGLLHKQNVEGVQTHVAIPHGEIDVLTPQAIFECKRMLLRDSLLQALGQLQLYAVAYPEHKLAIAGPLPHAKTYPNDRKLAKAMIERIQAIGVEIHVLPRMEPGSSLGTFLLSKELILTSAEIIAVEEIASICDQSLESLIDRLEKLTWRDGLMEFRMQSGSGHSPEWISQLQQLSDRINARLEQSDIPIGPSLKAYEAFSARD